VKGPRFLVASLVSGVGSGFLGTVLVWAVLSLSTEPGGLTRPVLDRLDETGVSHPVTAVLLGFRAYDTLLEVVVLLAAVTAALALLPSPDVYSVTQRLSRAAPPPPEVVIGHLAGLLVPVMGVVGIYLLALGTHSPGGAFQAGAVLGSAAVLLELGGWRFVSGMSPRVLAVTLGLATSAFLAAALLGPLVGRELLVWPAGQATRVIVTIELALTVSIAVTLAVLFLLATEAGEAGDADEVAPGAEAAPGRQAGRRHRKLPRDPGSTS
jgi:multisubunit Na+/H+ antiporter MnhB subunit